MNIKNLTDEEKNSIIEGSARAYVESCFEGVKKSARNEVTIKRLCRSARPIVDGLCEEFSSCEFEPTFFELNIGGDDGPEAASFITGVVLPIDGGFSAYSGV